MAVLKTTKILCFGDSNTWGYIPGTGKRFPFPQRWPGVCLDELTRLRPEVEFDIVEDGCSGRTCRYPLWLRPGTHGARALKKLFLRDSSFDVIIIALGINDLKLGNASSAAQVCEGLEQLVDLCREHCPIAALVLVSPPALDVTVVDEMFQQAVSASRELAEHYSELAATLGATHLAVGSLFSASTIDGIHYEAAGHARLGAELAEIVSRLLRA
jgi:lysophospholipase L1-like esterase